MDNNEILFKPNALILANADKALTSSEFKLYDTLLQRCQTEKNSPWRIAKLSRDEIKTIITNNDKSTVGEIKKILDKFVGISIKFKLGYKYYNSALIAEYFYNRITDTFTCSMSENVYMVLMSYSEFGYSPIDLKLVKKAKGFYTQRIYQLLRMWSRENVLISKTYSVEQLKEICDIAEGGSYDRYDNFKRKVLLPALKEINKKLNMTVEFEEIKSCRKITQIKFIFKDFEPRHYNFDDEVVIIDVENVAEKDKYKKIFENYSMKPLADTSLRKFEKEYGTELLERAICIMGENNRYKKISAPAKYLNSVLNNLKEGSLRLNPKSFVNFHAGTSDEKLKEIEEELLYGNKKDDEIEDNSTIPECLRGYLKESE